MAEPDVTLTDYGLTILCAVLAHLIFHRGRPGNEFRTWFVLFFAAVGASTLFGGTVHGFFPDETSLGNRILWPTTLGLIGVAGFSAWAVGARLMFSARVATWITHAAALKLIAYVVVVVFTTRDFLVAVADYVPATLFLLVGLIVAYRREPTRPLLVAAAGLVLTLAAAGLQQAGIGLHPSYFDHNALYHVIQAIALVLIYRGARYLAARDDTAATA